jgi:hypothetical protein
MAKWTLDHTTAAATIGSRNFEALRDPRTRGTMSTSFVNNKWLAARSTIRRFVERDLKNAKLFPEMPNPTPFDLTMGRLFDWDLNGGKDGFRAVIKGLEGFVHTPAKDVPGTVRRALGLSTWVARDPSNRFLTQFTVHAAAMDYLRFPEADLPYKLEQKELRIRRTNTQWAEWLLKKRRAEWTETSQHYEYLLRTALGVIGRLPRPGYTIMDIVNAMQALWSGLVFRSLMEPASYEQRPIGEGIIERAMWDLALGMTEEVVRQPQEPPKRDPVRETIDAALGVFRSNEVASITSILEFLYADTPDLAAQVLNVLPDDCHLANACVRLLVGSWGQSEMVDSSLLASSFNKATLPLGETMLWWLGRIRREYPMVFECAAFRTGDPIFEHAVELLAAALARHPGAVSSQARKDARRCVMAAVEGDDWEEALDVMLPNHRAETTSL